MFQSVIDNLKYRLNQPEDVATHCSGFHGSGSIFLISPDLLIFEMSRLTALQVMNTSHLVSCENVR